MSELDGHADADAVLATAFIRLEVVVVDVEVYVEQQVLVDADLRLIEVLACNIGGIGVEAQDLRRAHSDARKGVVLVVGRFQR